MFLPAKRYCLLHLEPPAAQTFMFPWKVWVWLPPTWGTVADCSPKTGQKGSPHTYAREFDVGDYTTEAQDVARTTMEIAGRQNFRRISTTQLPCRSFELHCPPSCLVNSTVQPSQQLLTSLFNQHLKNFHLRDKSCSRRKRPTQTDHARHSHVQHDTHLNWLSCIKNRLS